MQNQCVPVYLILIRVSLYLNRHVVYPPQKLTCQRILTKLLTPCKVCIKYWLTNTNYDLTFFYRKSQTPNFNHLFIGKSILSTCIIVYRLLEAFKMFFFLKSMLRSITKNTISLLDDVSYVFFCLFLRLILGGQWYPSSKQL